MQKLRYDSTITWHYNGNSDTISQQTSQVA